MEFSARPMEEGDLEMVRRWRMDPEVTRYMNTDPQITPEGQRQWFERVSADPTQRHWVVLADGVPVGVVNVVDIDLEHRIASWGYYVGERTYRSMPLAIAMELGVYDYCFETLGLETVRNEVLAPNEASIAMHRFLGNEVVEIRPGAIEKHGVAYDAVILEIGRATWEALDRSRLRVARLS